MAVGGLVITFSSDIARQASARRWIDAEPRLEMGPRDGLRAAVVATTDTLGEGHELCEALLAHPGVDNLEIAYVAPEEGLPHTERDTP